MCGAMNRSDDGLYLIANAEQFNWIAQKVADGETDAKIRLTADIDLAQGKYSDVMIGTSASQYGGEFDGQGHTVTYRYTVDTNYGGLFSYVKGATIRNLRVEGEATVTAIHFGALIGRSDGDVLVENAITNVMNDDQNEINWYQTLGEDEIPVLDETHATVFLNDNGTYSNTDGIQAATKEQPAQSGIIYNLQGQRIQNPGKGLYIIDRKKVMIK